MYSVDSTLGITLVILSHEACLKIARTCIKAASQQNADSGTDVEGLNSDSRSPRGVGKLKEYLWLFEYIADCGNYGDPPNVYKWAVQVWFAHLSPCTMCYIEDSLFQIM
jgi:hypothetical protein